MPVTALVVFDKNIEQKKYIRITTQPDEEKGGLIVIVEDMDPTFEFKQGSDIGTDARNSEEEYHKELRTMAAEKEQLITSHSTNPEWNPEGYTKNLSDVVFTYYCRDCGDDWVTKQEETCCTQCLGNNIEKR